MRLQMNQNPYSSPLPSSGVSSNPTIRNWVFAVTAVAGIGVASLCLYLALAYPVVRPPDWDGGMRFRVLTGIAKWGSFATILLGCIGYVKSRKSWLDKLRLVAAMSPAVVVIGLYLFWLILLA